MIVRAFEGGVVMTDPGLTIRELERRHRCVPIPLEGDELVAHLARRAMQTGACHPTAFPEHVLGEATAIAPWRNKASDGICGDARHAAGVSDHNPDSRGIPHAVDITQSRPDAPNWQLGMQVFDAHAYGELIAQRVIQRQEWRVRYLVSWNYATHQDKIFDPSIGRYYWRDMGTHEHANHLHTSFIYTVAAENSVAPFFGGAPVPVPGPTPTPTPAPHGGSDVLVVSHPTNRRGYWCITPDGRLYACGGTQYFAAIRTMHFNGPITGAAATATGNGLWLITQPGSVYTLGDAIYGGAPADTSRLITRPEPLSLLLIDRAAERLRRFITNRSN